MTITVSTLITSLVLLLAIFCFAVAAIWGEGQRVRLVPLGLGLFALFFLLPRCGVS